MCGGREGGGLKHNEISKAWMLPVAGGAQRREWRSRSREGLWRRSGLELGLCTEEGSDLSSYTFIFFYSARPITVKKNPLFSFHFVHNMKLFTFAVHSCVTHCVTFSS